MNVRANFAPAGRSAPAQTLAFIGVVGAAYYLLGIDEGQQNSSRTSHGTSGGSPALSIATAAVLATIGLRIIVRLNGPVRRPRPLNLTAYILAAIIVAAALYIFLGFEFHSTQNTWPVDHVNARLLGVALVVGACALPWLVLVWIIHKALRLDLQAIELAEQRSALTKKEESAHREAKQASQAIEVAKAAVREAEKRRKLAFHQGNRDAAMDAQDDRDREEVNRLPAREAARNAAADEEAARIGLKKLKVKARAMQAMWSVSERSQVWDLVGGRVTVFVIVVISSILPTGVLRVAWFDKVPKPDDSSFSNTNALLYAAFWAVALSAVALPLIVLWRHQARRFVALEVDHHGSESGEAEAARDRLERALELDVALLRNPITALAIFTRVISATLAVFIPLLAGS
jgi:hypothetical protein